MRCPKCGHEQPEAPECVRCGIVVSRFDPAFDQSGRQPAASEQHDRQVAAAYQKRARSNRRATGITLAVGLIAAGLAYLVTRQPGPPVYILVATIFTIIALSVIMLRCPSCSKIVGAANALSCPRCHAPFRRVRVRARADTNVVGEFERRRLRLTNLRRIQTTVFVIAMVLVVVPMAANIVPTWLERSAATTAFVVFAALMMGLYIAQRRIYRCPRCGKALFDDTSDDDTPLTDIDSCPFCGERLRA